MSVRTSERVWANSRHSGTELLLLLAIADFADDRGNAHPAVSTLAKKCRMTSRNVNHLLAALRAGGELEIRLNEGPKGTNRYRITLADDRVKSASPLKLATPPEARFTPETQFTLKPASAIPEGGFPEGLKPASDEPSLNRQEPSDRATAPPAGLPACPHRQLLTLFAEKVVDLPKPRPELWNGSKGAEAMGARWKWVLQARREDGSPYASNAAEALDWFGRFFDRVAESDFLTGRSGKFKCPGLEWLVKKDNFAKVVQGNYMNREAA